MTEEILRVKQILLGGANDMITKDELARLKSLLLRARPLLVEVTPNMQVLLFNEAHATVKQVTDARESLTKILDLIANEFEQHDEGRPEAGFTDLLNSAHKLGLENDSVANWVPLAESVKVLVLAGEPNQLRSREWAPMIRTIAQGWGLALRAKYNLSNNNELRGQDFPMLEETAREIVDLLDRAVVSHEGSIPNEIFEKLIDALQAKSMIPLGLQAETAKSLLPLLFGKMLYGRSGDNWDRHSLHFGSEQVTKLREIMNDWLAGQVIVNKIMNGQSQMKIADFGHGLADHKFTVAEFSKPETFTAAPRAQAQLLQFMAKGRPPIHDDQHRMIVETKKDMLGISKSDLDSINLIRVLIQSVIQGWTHDKSASQNISGLLESEVQEAYVDLRGVGHDLNLIDIRSNSAGIRTFMENSIFMSSSDGNDRMGLQEGMEWFHFVQSGGMIADDLYAVILKHRWSKDGEVCAAAKIDVLGSPKQRPDCFREGFLKEWANYFPNLPHLISWVKKDGTGERGREILTALETAGRTRGASQELVDSSEFRSMGPILHYLESLFARLDSDGDDILSTEEVWKAFPLLAPTIKKMGNGQADSEKIQKAVLAWILKFGSLPDTSSIIGKGKLMGWYVIYGAFDLSSDRVKILEVTASFAQAAKNSRVTAIKAFHEKKEDNLRALLFAREPGTVAQMADLFQCLPAGAKQLGLDMKSNINKITPVSDDQTMDADVFITEMKKIIDADSALESYCLPF